jgi:hypothetical protein
MSDRRTPTWKRWLITTTLLVFGSFVAYWVRVASGQFSRELNYVLFWVFLAFMMCLVEGLYWINRGLNKTYPFKENVPRRIAIQMITGVVYAMTLRFFLYQLGEP